MSSSHLQAEYRATPRSTSVARTVIGHRPLVAVMALGDRVRSDQSDSRAADCS